MKKKKTVMHTPISNLLNNVALDTSIDKREGAYHKGLIDTTNAKRMTTPEAWMPQHRDAYGTSRKTKKRVVPPMLANTGSFFDHSTQYLTTGLVVAFGLFILYFMFKKDIQPNTSIANENIKDYLAGMELLG